jgi:uncharacterized protein YbjT (DUF2867 family)
VDSLFWLTPPNMVTTDYRAFVRSVGASGAEAIHANKIGRVVNLSSVGAQMASGCGPVSGLHEVEGLLNAAATNIVHLRPGFFFENFLHHLESIHDDSAVYMPLGGLVRLPMIATRDIASVAARMLLSSTWTGKMIRGLHGPADLSLFEAVGQISEGLRKQIRYTQVPEATARKAMVSMGVSDSMADSLLEMYRAMNSGLMKRAEPRGVETTTPTRLVDFAREVILPLVLLPAHT